MTITLRPDMRVMARTTDGIAIDVGTAGEWFGERLHRIVVGEAQGADDSRGAYEWYPLELGDGPLGELREDACGMTIHLEPFTAEELEQ